MKATCCKRITSMYVLLNLTHKLYGVSKATIIDVYDLSAMYEQTQRDKQTHPRAFQLIYYTPCKTNFTHN